MPLDKSEPNEIPNPDKGQRALLVAEFPQQPEWWRILKPLTKGRLKRHVSERPIELTRIFNLEGCLTHVLLTIKGTPKRGTAMFECRDSNSRASLVCSYANRHVELSKTEEQDLRRLATVLITYVWPENKNAITPRN